MKKNLIRAFVETGKYKDQEVEVEIGKDSHSSKIRVNGKPLNGVFGIHLHIRIEQPTTLIIEKYAGEEKYINDEFEKWRKMPCYNPFGLDDNNIWVAKSFALYLLNRKFVPE